MNKKTRIAGLFLLAGLLCIASPALPQQAFPAQAPGASPQAQPYYGYQPKYYGYQPQWQAPVNQQPGWQSPAAPGQAGPQLSAQRRWPPAGTSAEWPPQAAQHGGGSNEWLAGSTAPAAGQSHTNQPPLPAAPAPAHPPSQPIPSPAQAAAVPQLVQGPPMPPYGDERMTRPPGSPWPWGVNPGNPYSQTPPW